MPAYAASIHKSQGSEYPAVVIPVMTQHYAMLQRNLLYTGVTHGSSLSFWLDRRRPSAALAANTFDQCIARTSAYTPVTDILLQRIR
jgi:exodeoxyribonuclease V alpha subunit